MKWGLTLVSRNSEIKVIYLFYEYSAWKQFGETSLNNSNQVQGHTERNPGSSALHFISNKTLLLGKGHLIVELYLF